MSVVESRKRKITFKDEIPYKKVDSKFTTQPNIFNINNNKSFSPKKISFIQCYDEKNYVVEKYSHKIKYLPSKIILNEKFMMNNEVVFEIAFGNEEIIINRLPKSKTRVVYVNNIKRAEITYDIYRKEKEIKCYYENGKLQFHRKVINQHNYNSYVSYLYNSDEIAIKSWREII
jgi:hypothetical protein